MNMLEIMTDYFINLLYFPKLIFFSVSHSFNPKYGLANITPLERH